MQTLQDGPLETFYEHKKHAGILSHAESGEGIRPTQLIVGNPGKWSPALDDFVDEGWNAITKLSTHRCR